MVMVLYQFFTHSICNYFKIWATVIGTDGGRNIYPQIKLPELLCWVNRECSFCDHCGVDLKCVWYSFIVFKTHWLFVNIPSLRERMPAFLLGLPEHSEGVSPVTWVYFLNFVLWTLIYFYMEYLCLWLLEILAAIPAVSLVVAEASAFL